MVAQNLKRGLFRLWVVGSVLWIAGQLLNIANLVLDRNFRPEDTLQITIFGAIFALGPPLLLLVVGAGVFWVVGGFQRRPGDGGNRAVTPEKGDTRWTWSSPETRALYDHLSAVWYDLVMDVANREATMPGPDGTDTWDRSLAGHRRFERALRAAVEDRFDAFFVDAVLDYGVANVSRDVGSLWRVNWTEVSTRLLAELGNVGILPSAAARRRASQGGHGTAALEAVTVTSGAEPVAPAAKSD